MDIMDLLTDLKHLITELTDLLVFFTDHPKNDMHVMGLKDFADILTDLKYHTKQRTH